MVPGLRRHNYGPRLRFHTARQTRRVSQQSADHVSKPRYEKSPLLRFGMKECTYGLDGFLVLVQMHTRGVGGLWGHTCVFQMALADWFSGSLPRSGMLEMFMIDAYVVANVAFSKRGSVTTDQSL